MIALAAAILAVVGPVSAAAPPVGRWALRENLANTGSSSAIKLNKLGATSFQTIVGINGSPRKGLRFDTGEGLKITGIAKRGTYTIELDVTFDDVAGYQRIVSFGPIDRDAGLYVLDGGTSLYPVKSVGADTPFVAGDWVTVRVSRNGVTGRMQVYTAGTWGSTLFTFKDVNNRYKLREGMVNLFQDDNGEDAEGTVTRLVLWDRYNPMVFGHD